MSKVTSIQWANTTVNPVMGCDGCELYPSTHQIRRSITDALINLNAQIDSRIAEIIDRAISAGPQYVKRNSRDIATSVAVASCNTTPPAILVDGIETSISRLYVCYAATLHRFFNANGKRSGYAYPFESPKEFPGRVSRVAALGAPKPSENADKPWLSGFPRLIFISDMGDALSRTISFEYLLKEVVMPVASAQGSRHIWLWVSKRPARMAEFSRWLNDHGVEWPENLVAMTTVTGPETVGRIAQLRQVNSRYRGLSLEPLWAEITPELDGIDWAIVGGESGGIARPFHLEWMEKLRDICHKDRVAFFAKQAGRRPFFQGQPLNLVDPHGGEWDEWPEHLRVRELPDAWRLS